MRNAHQQLPVSFVPRQPPSIDMQLHWTNNNPNPPPNQPRGSTTVLNNLSTATTIPPWSKHHGAPSPLTQLHLGIDPIPSSYNQHHHHHHHHHHHPHHHHHQFQTPLYGSQSLPATSITPPPVLSSLNLPSQQAGLHPHLAAIPSTTTTAAPRYAPLQIQHKTLSQEDMASMFCVGCLCPMDIKIRLEPCFHLLCLDCVPLLSSEWHSRCPQCSIPIDIVLAIHPDDEIAMCPGECQYITTCQDNNNKFVASKAFLNRLSLSCHKMFFHNNNERHHHPIDIDDKKKTVSEEEEDDDDDDDDDTDSIDDQASSSISSSVNLYHTTNQQQQIVSSDDITTGFDNQTLTTEDIARSITPVTQTTDNLLTQMESKHKNGNKEQHCNQHCYIDNHHRDELTYSSSSFNQSTTTSQFKLDTNLQSSSLTAVDTSSSSSSSTYLARMTPNRSKLEFTPSVSPDGSTPTAMMMSNYDAINAQQQSLGRPLTSTMPYEHQFVMQPQNRHTSSPSTSTIVDNINSNTDDHHHTLLNQQRYQQNNNNNNNNSTSLAVVLGQEEQIINDLDELL